MARIPQEDIALAYAFRRGLAAGKNIHNRHAGSFAAGFGKGERFALAIEVFLFENFSVRVVARHDAMKPPFGSDNRFPLHSEVGKAGLVPSLIESGLKSSKTVDAKAGLAAGVEAHSAHHVSSVVVGGLPSGKVVAVKAGLAIGVEVMLVVSFPRASKVDFHPA